MKNWLIYGILGFAAYKHFVKDAKASETRPASTTGVAAQATTPTATQTQAQATNNQSAVYAVES